MSWIKCSERLPPISNDDSFPVRYLTYRKGRISIMFFFDEFGIFSHEGMLKECAGDYHEEITHWMPLPEPPKDE